MATEDRVFCYRSFNLHALLSRATELRKVQCSCDRSTEPASGSLNWAVFIRFEDGVEWVFVSPRLDTRISPETTAKMIQSKVATMKFIKLNSSIPVPEVYDCSYTGETRVGIPYILMSKCSGVALSKFDWNPGPEGMPCSLRTCPSLDQPGKEKIMIQLGPIIKQLLDLRFDKIGSLFEKDGKYYIGDCLSPALIWHDRDSLGDEILRGPFQHTHQYLESQISAFLLHVKELPLEPHVFFAPIPELGEYPTYASYRSAVDRWNDFATVGSKVDSSKNRSDYSIAGYILQKIVPVMSQKLPGTLGDLDGYPLCHPDLSSSNIFVDEDLNITGIIDWECCSTVPIPTLLTTPNLPHPRDEIDTKLADIFKTSLSVHFGGEGGMGLDPAVWNSARRAWLFSRLVTLDGLQDYRYFEELYTSVYKRENIPKLFEGIRKQQDFVDMARKLAEDDLPEGTVKEQEEDYFHLLPPEREATARSLSQRALSDGLVADRTLWLELEARRSSYVARRPLLTQT